MSETEEKHKAAVNSAALWIADRATENGQTSYEKLDAECERFIDDLLGRMKQFVLVPHTRITCNV